MGGGNAEDIRKYAAELVALAPDVILASGGSVVGPLQEASSTVAIVFVQTPDPVGAGFVESLARPGGNATGFTTAEFGIGAKWLELLKQIAPGVTRVAVIRDAAIAARVGQLGRSIPVVLVRSRVKSDQRARPRRHGARRHGLRTLRECDATAAQLRSYAQRVQRCG